MEYLIESCKLSKEEEIEIFKNLEKARQIKDTEKIDELESKLISANCKLISFIIIKNFSNINIYFDDLYSVGSLGMIKAIRAFDLKRDNKFSTYAIRCIENEILMEIRKQKNRNSEYSLSAPYGLDKDGHELKYEDTIQDEQDIMLKVIEKDQKDFYINFISNNKNLDKKQKKVILYRSGLLGEPVKQQELAKKLNVSRSYISRIEKEAISILRKDIEKDRDFNK